MTSTDEFTDSSFWGAGAFIVLLLGFLAVALVSELAGKGARGLLRRLMD